MICSVNSKVIYDKSMLYLVGIAFKAANHGRNLSKMR